jgi:membrane protease YdiL (CAAX protease family)
MPLYPEPDPALAPGSVSVAVATLAFLAYRSIAVSSRLDQWLQHQFSREAAAIRKVLLQRLSGTLLYGLLPVLVTLLAFHRSPVQYGLHTGSFGRSLLWWIPVAVLVIALSYFTANTRTNLSRYPQIRVSVWTNNLLTLSAISWISYLAGYEFLFRGFLLFSCLESFGFWPALVINVSLYCLVHLPKGYRETIGSLFFGILLAHATLRLGSFWFAFLVHTTLALSNEWFSLAFHPEMKRTGKRNRV